jgi:hypothetical protein
MPTSALVTQLFSSLMRVYRSFPPVTPKGKDPRVASHWMCTMALQINQATRCGQRPKVCINISG